jgi:hypothetical protein
MKQWRIEVPSVNGGADRIRSVNHELADFFFLLWPRIFLRSKHSVSKLIDAL